jgi:non-heme chloroperoxidase
MVKSFYAEFATAMGLLLMASPAPQRKIRAIAAEGMSFAYVDLGSGPPVVLVHGSISDYREWSTQIEALAKHHRVIAYSRRYHWPNSPPVKDADATVARQAEDLAAMIKSLRLAPANTVGHSYGGTTALFLALQHPELVRSLVLLEPPVPGALVGTPENEMVVKEGQGVRDEMKQAFASGDAERVVRTYLALVAPGEFDHASPEIRNMYLANVQAFQLDFTSPRPALTCEDLQRIAAPTLVLTGGRSPMGLQQTAMGVARCLKGGNILKLPQATHHMQLDSRQEVNDAVLAFLAKH